MKKILLSALFLAFVIAGFTQSQMGLKIGYLNPNYKITSSPPNSNQEFTVDNGLNYAINYKRRWPGLFNFGGEIEFHQKKSDFLLEYKSLGADVYRNVHFNNSYLNLRLLPEFVYGEKLRAYFQVGPYMGFRLASSATGERVVTDGNGSITINEEAADVGKEFAPIDWGFFGGAGIEYPISERFKLGLEAQYSYGLAGFAQNDVYIFATRNFTASLSVIYVFKGYSDRIE